MEHYTNMKTLLETINDVKLLKESLNVQVSRGSQLRSLSTVSHGLVDNHQTKISV